MKIVIIGFATAYKTTVGQLLAEKLGLDWLDTDVQTEKFTKKSIPQIFAAGGESAFRQIESQVLKGLPQNNIVVSCGGGTVLCNGFADFCKNATVVWLKVSANTVVGRLGNNDRPLFDGLTKEELAAYVSRRSETYQKYATLIVDTDGKTSTEVCAELLKLLR